MKNPSIKKNFFMNALLTVSNFLFPLITFPYVSRVLQPDGMGKVSFALSLISYFTMIAQLGVPTYGIRACAKVRDDRAALTQTVQELMLINVVTCAISYVLLFLCLLFVPRLQDERALYLIVSLSVLFTSLGMEWLYKALEQYSYITIRSIAFKLIALLAMFALVHAKQDYRIYGAISIFAISASGVMNFIHARRYISMRPVGHYDLRRHLKAVLVFFAMTCATTIYLHLDTVMLWFMTSDTDVGYYDAAVKIKAILVGVVTSLGAVLLPRASYYVEQGSMEAFWTLTRKAMRFVFLLAVPLTVYFILYARPGVLLLSGSAYEGSVIPMQIIMPTLLLIGITNILGIQILVPLGREKTVLYSEIAGAVTDVVLNAALIPHFRAAGAAAGTLVAEFVVLVVQYRALRSEAGGIFRGLPFGKIIVGCALGAAASLPVLLLKAGSFLTLLLTAMLFFGLYGAVLLITKEPMVGEVLQGVRNKLPGHAAPQKETEKKESRKPMGNDQAMIRQIQQANYRSLKKLDEICKKYDIPYFAYYGTLLGAIRHNGFIPWDDDIDVAMMREDFDRLCAVPEEEWGEDFVLCSADSNDPRHDKMFGRVYVNRTRIQSEIDVRKWRVPSTGEPFYTSCMCDIFILDRVPDDDEGYHRLNEKLIDIARKYRMVKYQYVASGGAKELVKKLLGRTYGAWMRLTHEKPWQDLYAASRRIAADAEQGSRVATLYSGDAFPFEYDEIFPLETCPFEDMMIPVPHEAKKMLEVCYGDYLQLPPEDERYHINFIFADLGDGQKFIIDPIPGSLGAKEQEAQNDAL